MVTPKNKICVDCMIACAGERCLRCANKKKNTPEFYRKHRLGKKHTEESKLKMVETRRKNGNLGKMTEEMKKKISKSMQGENSPNWQGGITPVNKKARWNLKGTTWRDSVFKRDNYTCQAKNCKYCNNTYGGNYLEAHHIKLFSSHHELRHDIENGITYCKEYHRKEVDHRWSNKIQSQK